MKNNESPSFSHFSDNDSAIEFLQANPKDSSRKEYSPQINTKHKFGAIDAISVSVCFSCLAMNEFINNNVLHYAILGICVSSLFVSTALQVLLSRHQFGINSIYHKFRKLGLNPKIDGNTIHWIFQGKMYSLRLDNGCQLQISREYPLEPEIGVQFECAAIATMNEVFSAKVGVHREDEKNGNIFFSTEMLCSSMKELGKILPATVGILDAAEERQRENLRELLKEEKKGNKKSNRKIGFVQN